MRRRSPLLETIGVTFLVVGLVLALPVILPVVLFRDALVRRRLRRAALRFHCQTCGTLLGLASIELADATQKAEDDAFMKAHPGVKARKILRYHAICASCGTRYRFDSRESFIMWPAKSEERLERTVK